MAKTTVPYDAIVEKLLRETREGNIDWHDVSNQVRRRDVVGLIYSTRVEDQDILLYEYQYKTFDEFDQPELNNEVAIEFVDIHNNLLLKFPSTDERWPLLREVRRTTSGIDDFAEKFLKKGAKSSSDADDES